MYSNRKHLYLHAINHRNYNSTSLDKKLIAMDIHSQKILQEALTYDDVLLVPAYSNVLPREVSLKSKFTKNIGLNIPIISSIRCILIENIYICMQLIIETTIRLPSIKN